MDIQLDSDAEIGVFHQNMPGLTSIDLKPLAEFSKFDIGRESNSSSSHSLADSTLCSNADIFLDSVQKKIEHKFIRVSSGAFNK